MGCASEAIRKIGETQGCHWHAPGANPGGRSAKTSHKSTILNAHWLVSGCQRANVVDSVAVKSSSFNTVQQLVGNEGLKTEGLPGGFQVENLVPNQVLYQAEPLPDMLCGCESPGAAWCFRPVAGLVQVSLVVGAREAPRRGAA